MDKRKPAREYTWSSYFTRKLDEKGNIKRISPLGHFNAEQWDNLIQTVGMLPLTKAVLDLMVKMLIPESELKVQLLTLLSKTQGKTEEEVHRTGGNIASLLVKCNDKILRGQNFSDMSLCYADFTRADLTGCNLDYADLSRVTFEDAILRDASLRESNMRNVN